MRGIKLASLLLLIVSADMAFARPPHKQSLRWYYGDLLPAAVLNCSTCHLTREQVEDPAQFDEESPPHNSFGARLAEVVYELSSEGTALDIPAGLRAIAGEDADGDGVENELELVTGHLPGIRDDRPSPEEIAAVRSPLTLFREQQAAYPWEPFRAVSRPAVPELGSLALAARHPIDAFIAQQQQARGLVPRPEAMRAVLLRRVYLDLIGLPPTRDELQAFLADESPDAYERVVDRLLAHPGYGERWGRHWMDVWRYSDWAGWTGGKQIRDSQPHIWRWRDWIVQSLNDDKPYDTMVMEMLAADEQWPTDTDRLRATGFLVRNYKMLSREIWMQDTVNHTMLAFLGLTVGCARCHDHMYDAISQSEYYQLRAIFEPYRVRLDRLPQQPDTTKDGLARAYDAELEAVTYLYRKGDDRDPDKDRPMSPGVLSLLGMNKFSASPVPLEPAAFYPGLEEYVRHELIAAAEADVSVAEKQLQETKSELGKLPKSPGGPLDLATKELVATKAGLAEKIVAAHRANLAALRARIAADDARYARPPGENAHELAVSASRLEREAKYAQALVDVVKAELKKVAANLAVKPADPKTESAYNEAKKALADAEQARDAADKARQETSDVYSPLSPVYPERSTGRRTALARWITDRSNPLTARVAVNQIWMRHFGRPLVASVFDFGRNGQQPSHPALLDWLATELMEPEFGSSGTPAWSMKHLHRLIVTSRTYRQASTPDERNLAIDPDNRWFWRMPSRRMEAELVRDGILYVAGELNQSMGGPDISHQKGLEIPRRSIYFQHAQEKQMEFLKMFDAAAVTECYQRKESIVPQQALAMANSELTRVQARIIARRLRDPADEEGLAFIAAAFEQVLARPATPEELQVSMAFLDEQRAVVPAEGAESSATSDADPSKPARDPLLRAQESFVHVLLNHHDFVTIR